MITIGVIGAVVIGGGSFYAGTKVAGDGNRPGFAQMGQEGQMRVGQNGVGGMQNRQGVMAGGVVGEIVANDGATITVKFTDTASSSDLTVGESVTVRGAANPEGFPTR